MLHLLHVSFLDELGVAALHILLRAKDAIREILFKEVLQVVGQLLDEKLEVEHV